MVGLVVFGAVATVLPVLLATGLFWLLPEKRGREPEDLWAEEHGGPGLD